MNWHPILIFLHVVGGMGLAASTFLALFSQLALRRATQVEEARSILRLVALTEPVAATALILTPTAGIIMAVNTWGWQHGWINVALGSMVVLLMPVGAATGLRRRAIHKQLDELPDGLLPLTVKQRIHDPLLGTTVNLMVILVLGIVFLMTTKPAVEGALVAMAVSLMIGLAVSLPLWLGKAAATKT